MSGISDKAQALLLTVSIFLISLPTIVGIEDHNLKIILVVLGLLGIAIKEGLGNKPVQQTPTI